jgi:hypothetical protein
MLTWDFFYFYETLSVNIGCLDIHVNNSYVFFFDIL